MIVLTEELQNILFKYYFINKFEWATLSDVDRFQSHPLPGRVYRGLYNTQTKLTKLVLTDPPSPTGIGFESLSNSDPEKGYVCEIQELTLDNILDFKIDESDLDNIIKWQTSENKDLKNTFEPNPIQHGLLRLKAAMNKQEQEELSAMDRASNAMLELWQANSLKFDIMINFIEFIINKDYESYNDAANYLTHHPVNGKGINIANALRHLDNYVNDDRRVNEDINDLMESMNSCVVEIERKIDNNLID